MSNKPIGVFDSGLGGLTAVRELRKLMPDENIVYFGDTGRMPYGGRPREQMRVIARQNIDFVERFDVKAVLVACGTISSTSPDILQANKIKTIGVLTPGATELAATGKRRLGVIATEASIKSGAFQKMIAELRPDASVLAAACPKFVPMIESGRTSADDDLVRSTVASSLAAFKDYGVEALLLGCTHFGLIGDAISDFLGHDVQLIGASDASARSLARYLRESGLAGGDGEEKYYTSGSVSDFESLAPLMLGYKLKSGVKYVEPQPV